MKIDGKSYRTIWLAPDGCTVQIINQNRLPHEFLIENVTTLEEMITAIVAMKVRGAPLIGAATAYGMALSLLKDGSDENLERSSEKLAASRPTAINLRWALEKITSGVLKLDPEERGKAALDIAATLCDEDVDVCSYIGDNGLALVERIAHNKKATGASPVNILTHCNAGWLATVDWGTALAPIYKAHDAGVPVHVWVDETRPRNQGAFLTAFELASHGVPHTVIVDNAGGHLMQHGLVDLCLVGTDRTTATGDVCNKIGTYLKALSAKDNNIPFYVCVPSSSIDWSLSDGLREIPIEQRSEDEVRNLSGLLKNGEVASVELFGNSSQVRNDGFDVTPSRLVTGLITERGVCLANRMSLAEMFPDCTLSN